jgi:hypothetical protein
MDLAALKAALGAGRVVITQHADREARTDGLNLTEVRVSGLSNGDIIEDYPDDPRGQSCLILCTLPDGRPVHTCWGYQSSLGWATLITIYRPDAQPHKWSPDWRSRIKGQP